MSRGDRGSLAHDIREVVDLLHTLNKGSTARVPALDAAGRALLRIADRVADLETLVRMTSELVNRINERLKKLEGRAKI